MFDDQQRLAKSQCRGDRVHTAGNGEEPAIQVRTCLLIGLQQPTGFDGFDQIIQSVVEGVQAISSGKRSVRSTVGSPSSTHLFYSNAGSMTSRFPNKIRKITPSNLHGAAQSNPQHTLV